jgi:hypothetical protein
VHVDEQKHIDDLLVFLRKVGDIALRVDGGMLEIHLPEATSEHAERLELGVYLSCWQALHPEATLLD